MPLTAVHLDIPAGEISGDDRRSLDDLAQAVADDETLTPHARTIAVSLLKQLADGGDTGAHRPEYLSPNKAAAIVGVSRPLLNRILDEGRIKFDVTAGGHRRIKRADVLAYVANCDKVADELAEARRNRRTPGQKAADRLGLTDEQARRLGFN